MKPAPVRFYVLASLFAALTAAGAFIKIPLPYVPITMQDFFVILSGALLGPVYGALSQVFYLLVGLAGVPVFALGGGPGYVFQPTFGYLLAYPAAAFVVGYVVWGGLEGGARAEPKFVRIFGAGIFGAALIFVFGVTGLYLNLKFVLGKPISWQTALWTGFVVFIPGSLLKLAVASFMATKLLPILANEEPPA